MGLSSNILWHQTKIDGLKGILKEKGFFYSYSLEKIHYGENYSIEAAFPMVSVCDLPLCEFGGYLNRYQGYSIGLSREWGIKNCFTPVWYCEERSLALQKFMEMFDDILSKLESEKFGNKYIEQLLYLIAHIKNYEGELPKKNYKSFRFYDERELRVIPPIEALKKRHIEPFLLKQDYESFKANDSSSIIKNKSIMIPFDWDDIKYIIVSRDNNIDEFKELIKKLSKRDDLKINFFTNTQIKEDVIGGEHIIPNLEILSVRRL